MQLKSLKPKLKVFFGQKVNNAKLTFRLSTGSEKCIYFFGYFVWFSFFRFLVTAARRRQAQQVASGKFANRKWQLQLFGTPIVEINKGRSRVTKNDWLDWLCLANCLPIGGMNKQTGGKWKAAPEGKRSCIASCPAAFQCIREYLCGCTSNRWSDRVEIYSHVTFKFVGKSTDTNRAVAFQAWFSFFPTQ